MKSRIAIPLPCDENWQAMSSTEQGKFCDKCCHFVIDFSQKSTAEISEYLKAKSGERVCGRIRRDQLAIPASASRSNSRYRVFFAALYFVFGGLLFTSCSNQNEEVMGKMEANADTIRIHDSLNKSDPTNLQGDSIHEKDSLKKGQAAKKMRISEPPRYNVGIITEDFFHHDTDSTKK